MSGGEDPDLAEAGDRAATSRRTFLALAGAAGTAGIAGTPVGASPTTGDGTVRIAAANAERHAAQAAVATLQERGPEPSPSLSVDETTAGAAAFAAGEADVLVASRPLAPDERAGAREEGLAYRRREVPTAVAALRHPESTWIECLSPAQVTETWDTAGAVETWAEVPAGDAVSDEGADATRPRGSPGGAPADAGTPLVRGVREFQYASGYGGVGYYRPAGEWLDGRSGRGRDDATTLVRLAFVYASRPALERGSVTDFLDAFTGRSDRRVGQWPYVGQPG